MADDETREEEVTEEEAGTGQETHDDDREPGGADGDSVRARKEYRARKRMEAAFQAEHEEKIRLEERLRALEQRAVKQPAEEKILSSREVRRLVDNDEWTQDQADEYLDKVTQQRIDRAVQARLESSRTEQQKQRPIETAAKEIEQYTDVYPDLLEPASDRRARVKARFDHYVNELGYESKDVRTELLAIRDVLGPVDKLKKRREVAQTTRESQETHAEVSAGGEQKGGNGKAPDLSKAPEAMQKLWKGTGTPQKQREEEFAEWQKRHATDRRAG